MSEDLSHKTINKNNTGFPEYLDFGKLRSSAIEYLGKLSGKVWTDHNVHDPGITILEMLIYALLDLGYRTNLPAIDLFTRHPDDQSVDNNFFTPSQILGNNPLTITDYRKLIVDIEGVKNAWLEIEEKAPVEFCEHKKYVALNIDSNKSEKNSHQCETLNGLYHILVQLEEKIYDDIENREKVIGKIKNSLMAHRNLCEDFIDIKVLCKLEIGLCVEIELSPDAEPGEVYLKISEILREYFSPSPRFYSLQQLLDKQKSIDEIFAGRPFNVTESHGFVDTEEFEQLKLRRELHLSDVYHLLYDIAGINKVRNLGWKFCNEDKAKVPEWKLVVPENSVFEFSPQCSGFTFTRNGLPVKVDLKKYDSFLKQKFSGLQKALYKVPSPFLDPEFPQGIYRNDLGDYYSIQNEFPRVYGISEGGLSSDATDKRKAQALQLQGFLLFFDQLLANYLTQLKNLRSLFSLSSSVKSSDNHTYFINQLTNVPQLQKLLRFNNDGTGSNLGTEGSILAYPADRKKLEELIKSEKSEQPGHDRKCNNDRNKDFPLFTFCFAAVRDQALNQLKDDLLSDDYEPIVLANDQGCFFFVIFTSSPDFAIVSKRDFKSEKEAANAASSVKYSGTFSENYRSFIIDDCETQSESFSFDIELNLNIYSKYLQLIVEDKELFLKRRQDFLEHLLSRFAEQFTDYAMLSAPFLSKQDLKTDQIKAEERFLGHYDDISSNRGKAFDYLKGKWGSENVSGFEKKFKATAGIENWNRHYLCNFVVEKADKLYHLTIYIFDQAFTVEGKTVTREQAIESYQSVFKKLSKAFFELRSAGYNQLWQVYIQDEYGNQYAYGKLFEQKEEASSFIDTITSVVNFKADFSNEVFVSSYFYKVILTDHAGVSVAESIDHFSSLHSAENYLQKTNNHLTYFLSESDKSVKHNGDVKLDKLLIVSIEQLQIVFIDERKFLFKNTDESSPGEGKNKFSVFNLQESIQFDFIKEYDSVELAKKAFQDLLILLPSDVNYSIEKKTQSGVFQVFVKEKESNIAAFAGVFRSKKEAQEEIKEVISEINNYTFKLSVTEPLPGEWEFKYRSRDLSGNVIEYVSEGNYTSEEEARKKAKIFYSNIPSVSIKSADNIILLELEKNHNEIKCAAPLEKQEIGKIKMAENILHSSQKLIKQIANPSEQVNELLQLNQVDHGNDYIYKLVDKDNLIAFYPHSINKGKKEADDILSKLIGKAVKGYNYVEIASGGDIVNERKDAKTGVLWFHYQIKCTNRKYRKGKVKGNDLVLFESTKGYTSKEEAAKAFYENYLIVLKHARKEENYGPDKLISFEEVLIHNYDPCYDSKSIVFVPRETSDEWNGYEVQKDLILMVGSYPVRYMRKNKYKFVLGHIDDKEKSFETDWCSKVTYETAEEAMKQFYFFKILLKYPGNFYTELSKTDCRYHIFMREVLAVSAHGFSNPEDAWGEEGVEKFICVTQSENGFHNYFKRSDCSNSFFVACGNTGLVHPCVYDTPRRRDAVLNKLYEASAFNFFNLIDLTNQEAGYIVLNDLHNKPLVIIPFGRGINWSTFCEQLIKFSESVQNEKNYSASNNRFQLIYRNEENSTYQTIAESYAEVQYSSESLESKLQEWKAMLQEIACLFPVVKKENPDSSASAPMYFVEIKLPGFDSCGDDLLIDDPCSRPCQDESCKISCHVAWKSDCCFKNCCDALMFYARSFLLINKYENYKPIFDCECGTYRIGLYPLLTLKDNNDLSLLHENLHEKINVLCAGVNNDTDGIKVRGGWDDHDSCLNEIIAINPQAYTDEKMACEAVARARKLINSEGLHLVEHILLRPRCKNVEGGKEDCNCGALPQPCDKDQFGSFKWAPGGESDPCKEDKVICFTPGYDPYSFIATIALPAWTERFRSASSRRIVERLLQREAPAHVLVRILWLNPRDFNCFEGYYKNWTDWLSQKICDPEYSNCDFLNFLFQTQFEFLSDCDDCQPTCEEQPLPCLKVERDRCDYFHMSDTINQLFCWSDHNERRPETNRCEP